MSKKTIKHQQSPKEPAPILNLAKLQIATKVVISLPAGLEKEQINIMLMSHYIRSKLMNKKVEEKQDFMAVYLGKEMNFQVVDAEGINAENKEEDSFVIGEDTKIEFVNRTTKSIKKDLNQNEDEPFYGLEEEFQSLKQIVVNTLFHREELIQAKLGPLKGVLIGGYSGTGKSLILRHLLKELKQLKNGKQIFTKSISSTQLLSKVVGGAEEHIRKIFVLLKQNQPAVLAIEDMHLLFGRKEVVANETALATLLSEMDKIYHEQIIIISTYNCERDLDRSIRSSGKFQKQIKLSLPNHHERFIILERLILNIESFGEYHKNPHMKDQLKYINLRLNGFSIGQIKQILRESYMKYSKTLTIQGIEEVLKGYRPSEIKDLIVEVPEVYWSQIGGYEEVKKQIKKVTELPLKHPEIFSKFGIQPIKGIMLYGPPGCSKTMMAKAIATQSKLNFIGIKGPELFSKYVGESERAIRNIFKRARACSPCIIFFDEIDALATQRSANTEVSDRVLCQLLNQMDGIEGLKEVVIVAATNRPQILDKALMRPGRFDYLIYVSPPDKEARKEIFKIYLKKTLTNQDIDELSLKLAERTMQYTGAEISLICRQAALIALEQSLQIEAVEEKHFNKALEKIKKRVTRDMVKKYEQFSQTLKYQ